MRVASDMHRDPKRAALVTFFLAAASVGAWVLFAPSPAPEAPGARHADMEAVEGDVRLPAPSSPAAPPTRDEGAKSAPVAVVDPLVAALESTDEAAKIAAVEDAVRAGAVDAIPRLAAVELRREPESAPTIIHALASLGARGAEQDRRLAARTLSRWLREETRREGRDASGNVPNLIEALGEIGGREATDALADALESGTLDLPGQTLAAQRLADVGGARAREAIERFAQRAASASPNDDFEQELREEAIAEASSALARLDP